MKRFLYIATLLVVLAGCKSAQKATTAVIDEQPQIVERPSVRPNPREPVIISPEQAVMPPAIVYKTNGNYDNNVVASYDHATGRFISYPDPRDVSAASAPVRLADGWLLDRQGMIGNNSVFLKWTYEEYHNLPQVPAVDQLREAIIPDARVTAHIPVEGIPASAASNDTAFINRYIQSLRVDLAPAP